MAGEEACTLPEAFFLARLPVDAGCRTRAFQKIHIYPGLAQTKILHLRRLKFFTVLHKCFTAAKHAICCNKQFF